MTGDQTFENNVQAEMKLLRAEEDEKRMLFDRTIGGELVPRPSRDFIEKSVGPLRSEEELLKIARQNAERQRRELEAATKRDQEFQMSLREHNRRIEARKEGRGSAPAPERGTLVQRARSILAEKSRQDRSGHGRGD